MEFVVFVGCAHGGQYHLNKYEKYQKNVKKWNSKIILFFCDWKFVFTELMMYINIYHILNMRMA